MDSPPRESLIDLEPYEPPLLQSATVSYLFFPPSQFRSVALISAAASLVEDPPHQYPHMTHTLPVHTAGRTTAVMGSPPPCHTPTFLGHTTPLFLGHPTPMRPPQRTAPTQGTQGTQAIRTLPRPPAPAQA
jgi:hypothetical protein